MHKEKSRALIQHVRMKRCDLNARLSQLANYRIYLVSGQHEVSSDGDAFRSRLKVDCSSGAHERWDFGSVSSSDLFFPRNSELQHAAAVVSLDAERVLNLTPVKR